MKEIDVSYACRTCIFADGKLLNIHTNKLNIPLKEILEIDCTPNDGLPQNICNICTSLLMKYSVFKQKCAYAQNLLKDSKERNSLTPGYGKNVIIIESGVMGKIKTFTINNLNKITEITYEEPIIKQEEILIDENNCYEDVILVKDEILSDPKIEQITVADISYCDFSSNEDMDMSNDSCKSFDIKGEESLIKDSNTKDNETHLKVNKLPNRKTNTNKKLCNIKKRCIKKNDKRFKVKLLKENNVELKQLSKEEQLDEVLSKKSSINYLTSRFKCDQCYKGFLREVTYQNHMKKHDPKSGPFACEICKVRFMKKRQRDDHTNKLHSAKYTCTLCDHVSISWGQARSHNNYHQGVLFKCEKCNKEFQRPTTYYSHMRLTHTSDHVCNICGERFLSSLGLQSHTKKGHKGEELTNYCEACNLYFKSDAAFETHLATASVHNKDGANNCNYCNRCGESFQTNEELKMHSQTHKKQDKEDKVRCEICNRMLANSRQYAAHYQRHHIEEASGDIKSRKLASLVCELCGEVYTNSYFFEDHKRKHTGEKPYKCRHCPKAFRTTTLLKSHERIHTDERPFKCPSCPKAFRWPAGLSIHSRVHSGEKPYQCAHCGKSFSQWSSHKLHETTVHFKLPAPYKKKKKNRDLE